MRQTITQPAAGMLMSTAEVLTRLGIGETTLWRMEKRGEFPKAVMLGKRCKRWREADIEAYVESLGR